MGFKKVEVNITYPLSKGHKLKAGAKVVSEGTYVGAKEGQFGLTHRFKQSDGKIIGLSGGHLNWMVDEEIITSGRRYNVFWDGMQTVQKGSMAGKDAHTFSIEEEQDEAAPLPVDKKAAAAATPAAAPTSAKSAVKGKGKKAAPVEEEEDEEDDISL